MHGTNHSFKNTKTKPFLSNFVSEKNAFFSILSKQQFAYFQSIHIYQHFVLFYNQTFQREVAGVCNCNWKLVSVKFKIFHANNIGKTIFFFVDQNFENAILDIESIKIYR